MLELKLLDGSTANIPEGRRWLRKPERLFLSDRPYYLERTLEQGEGDLLALAETAKYENGWVFSDDVWINTTLRHIKKKVKIGKKTKIFYFVETHEIDHKSLKEPIQYHIHPQDELQGISNNYMGTVTRTNYGLVTRFDDGQAFNLWDNSLIKWHAKLRIAHNKANASLLARLFLALPSDLDLEGRIDNNSGLKAHRLVSPPFITEYGQFDRQYLKEYNNEIDALMIFLDQAQHDMFLFFETRNPFIWQEAKSGYDSTQFLITPQRQRYASPKQLLDGLNTAIDRLNNTYGHITEFMQRYRIKIFHPDRRDIPLNMYEMAVYLATNKPFYAGDIFQQVAKWHPPHIPKQMSVP